MSRPVVVDFLGPPGAGKSFLCRNVLEQLGASGSPWMGMEEARKQAIARLLDDYEAGSNGFRKLLLHWGAHRFRVVQGLVEPLQDELAENFTEESSRLFEALVSQWFDPDMKLPPPEVRREELWDWVGRWLFCLVYSGASHVLADNARFTRGIAELLFNLSMKQDAREAVAREYLSSAVAPAATIYVFTAPDLVLERIKTREAEAGGQRHAAHRGLSDDNLLAYTEKRLVVNARAVEFFFEGEGVPVCRIDSGEPWEENARLIHEFLLSMV